mgnify:CR=1 FL=1
MKITEVKINKLTYDDLTPIRARSGNKAAEQARKRMHEPTNIYVWPKGESILENLENRHQRPYTIYKKEVIPGVLRQMGLPSFAKVRWSQKAGCPCGCSPAFIVVDGHYGADVHVTIE